MDKRKITIVIITIIVYILSAGISYAIFSNGANIKLGGPITSPVAEEEENTGDRMSFDSKLPKTEACPLNGVLYSKQQREWWETHRPLGIMIENHENSRPQSGLSFADIIYEVVAEGGITRFLSIFYCQDGGQVGPVRSARTYFLDFISEYGQFPLYAHVGGANTPGPADALSQIQRYEWTSYNDMNQFSIGFPTFWRDYDRLGHEAATEHTMYSTTAKLWEFAKDQRKLTNVDTEGIPWDEGFLPYSFKEDNQSAERPASQTVSLSFWEGYKDYDVEWTYDKEANIYKRNNGGAANIDKNTDKQLTTKNIAILFMSESRANDGYEGNVHLLYKTKGSGKAQFFMDGEKITGTWRKSGRTEKTLLFDSNGKPVTFNRGTLWFQILPLNGRIVVK